MITDQVRQELARLLNSLPAYYAITLKYSAGPVGMEKIDRDLKALRARVDRAFLGRHYARSPDRCTVWAVAEMLDVAPHVHTAWHFSSHGHANAMARLLASGVWETTFAPGGGSYDLQVYDKDAYAPAGNGWAGYATKSLKTLDHVILPNDVKIEIADPD